MLHRHSDPARAASCGTLAVLLMLTLLPAFPAAAADSTVYTFVGGGWGHSTGMSQYGAYGMSKEGFTSTEIVEHYYEGSSVAAVDPAHGGPVWVNISTKPGTPAVSSATFNVLATGAAPTVPVVLSNGVDTVEVAVGSGFTIATTGVGTCTLTAGETVVAGGCTWDGEWDGWVASPTTMVQMPGCANPSGPACRFARGSLRIRPVTGAATMNVSLEIDIEHYTLGIAEMPGGWGSSGGAAALEAQAITARSYALRSAYDRGLQAWCACHLYATTVDQSYVGYGYGASAWVAAVAATAGLVVTHPSSQSGGVLLPLKAFYSSSTYGWTESYVNGFGGTDRPWLQPVDDHWSANISLNPNARWSYQFTGAQLAAALNGKPGVPPLVTVNNVAITKCSPSGAALEITFWGEGNSVKVKTRDLRGWLGLKSMQVINAGAADALPTTPPCPSPLPASQGSLPDDLIGSVGLHDPSTGIFTLHDPAGDLRSFYFGNRADIPYSGDWDCDGITSLGLYRVSTGFLFLRNSNTQGIADVEIYYGNPGDRPLAGDWDNDDCETVGIYRPSNNRFYLRNTNTQGIADVEFSFGNAGDQPLAGDWDGDGTTTVGVYRPSTKMLYLANTLGGPADFSWHYEGAQVGDIVIVGDWDGDGVDTVGVFRPSTGAFYLRNDYVGGADFVFFFGDATLTPLSGRWS